MHEFSFWNRGKIKLKSGLLINQSCKCAVLEVNKWSLTLKIAGNIEEVNKLTSLLNIMG